MKTDSRLRQTRQKLGLAKQSLISDAGLGNALRRSIGLATPREPPIGYLGFARQGNAGDDAILLGHTRSLAPARLAMLPLAWERETLSLLGNLRGRALFHGVLVGGGTLVGRPEWRRRLGLALAGQSGPLALTGVGVEDPEFSGRRSYTDPDELRRWSEILEGAAHVTVRGPRSAELLRDVGIQAPVASDPALLLAYDRAPVERTQPKLLGVNLADPEDEYRGSGSRVWDACYSALRTVLSSGWRVRLLPFDRKDLVVAEAMCRALDGRAEVVRSFARVDVLIDSIAECDVLVGQRLHSTVLAAAAAVPALAIDYRPKCRDFQLSINRGEWTISTLDITAASVVDAVSALHERRDYHADQIHMQVLRARSKLAADNRHLRDLLVPA
jgi:hypothetical protein